MEKTMKVIFYDVEHGSCCHIITPNFKHILVDVGSKTSRSIVEYMYVKYFMSKSSQVDSLIITHPHEDHIYDLPNLKRILPPQTLVRDSDAFDIVPLQNTKDHIEIAESANSMNRSYCYNVPPEYSPLEASVNGGVNFKVISPSKVWTDKKDLNTFSSIIVVEYNKCKFVLTGDNPAKILRQMMETNFEGIKEAIKDATILLAPHHGRTGEFCQEFFDCVNPVLTVVSDKPIEHETQEDTAKLYRGRGKLIGKDYRYVLTTRKDGAISFEVGTSGYTVELGKEDY